jgi:hypothetical protein
LTQALTSKSGAQIMRRTSFLRNRCSFSAPASMRQHTSAYVSIRQHTSAEDAAAFGSAAASPRSLPRSLILPDIHSLIPLTSPFQVMRSSFSHSSSLIHTLPRQPHGLLPQPLSNISAQEGSRSRGSCRERGRQDEKKRKRKKLRERQVADITRDRHDIRVPYDVEAKCNTPHTTHVLQHRRMLDAFSKSGERETSMRDELKASYTSSLTVHVRHKT